MNGYGEGSPYCHFHPNEFVVGICALCLKERLNALALKQGRHDPLRRSTQGRKFLRAQPSRQPAGIPKVFALASLLHLLEPLYSSGQEDDGGGGGDDDDKGGSIASLEDSFISIKFEGNGRATWEKKKKTASKEQSKKTCTTAPTTTAAADDDDDDDNNGNAVIRDRKEEVLKTMVELPKRGGGAGTLRWRKRIGHILQLTRWKRSGKVEGGGIKGSGRQREVG